MSRPKISVVIPAFNCAGYIEGAVNSVLNQSLKDIEVLVIDDGSTDHTQAVMTQVQAAHADKVRYIYQKNTGVSGARNKGIDQARGECIAFLDADDEFGPDFFEKGLELMGAGKFDIVIPANYCHRIVTEDGREELEQKFREPWPALGHDFYHALCTHFIGSIGMLARKDCFYDCRFDAALPGGEDYDMWLMLTEKGFKAVMLETETPQFFYLIRQGSAMNSTNKKGRRKYLKSQCDVLKKHAGFALHYAPDLKQVFADKYWRFGMELIRNDRKDLTGYFALAASQRIQFSSERLFSFCRSAKEKIASGKSHS